jgi:hypothetical protein
LVASGSPAVRCRWCPPTTGTSACGWRRRRCCSSAASQPSTARSATAPPQERRKVALGTCARVFGTSCIGLKVSLAGANDKLTQLDRRVRNVTTVDLGMPLLPTRCIGKPFQERLLPSTCSGWRWRGYLAACSRVSWAGTRCGACSRGLPWQWPRPLGHLQSGTATGLASAPGSGGAHRRHLPVVVLSCPALTHFSKASISPEVDTASEGPRPGEPQAKQWVPPWPGRA